VYIRVTLYGGYLNILYLFHSACILYCVCFNLLCNVWVCVCGFVLLICVLVFTVLLIVCTVFFCIVSFMCIYCYLVCFYRCKDYCHEVTTQLQLIIIIIRTAEFG
jgi:hypothetical protein